MSAKFFFISKQLLGSLVRVRNRKSLKDKVNHVSGGITKTQSKVFFPATSAGKVVNIDFFKDQEGEG